MKVWDTDEIDDYKAGLEFARERLERAKSSEMQTFWQKQIKQIEEMLQSYEKDVETHE